MEEQKLQQILTKDDIITSINENIYDLLNIIPEIKDMIGFEHNHPHHHLDVWNHTLLALSTSPNDFKIRLVLLLHDIGKPHSYQDLEVRHFQGHADKSSEIANNILTRLEIKQEEINEICYMIKYHDTMISDELINNNKLLAQILFKIQTCDALAHNPTKLEKRKRYLMSLNKKINNELEQEELEKLISNISINNNKLKIKK